MGRVSLPAETPSIAPGAEDCTFFSDSLHQILGRVQTLHPTGTVKWLQRVTGKSPRTCKYWLAGRFQPDGNSTLKIAAALRAELRSMQSELEQYELDL